MEKQTKPTDSKHFMISILIRQNGYSFLVTNSTTNQIEEFGETSTKNKDLDELLGKIKEEFSQSLKNKYAQSSLRIFYQNSYFALVPSSIYDDQHASDYLKYNTELFPSDSLSCDKNDAFDIHIPFIPLINIHNELLDHFDSLDFYTAVNSALKASFNFCKHQNGEHAFVYLQQSTFILVLIKNGKLQAANFFEFETAEDFAYYALFVIEQFKFDREKMHFSFVGEINKEEQIYQYMQTYIRYIVNISIAELKPNYSISSSQEDQFLNTNPILALQLCESFQEN